MSGLQHAHSIEDLRCLARRRLPRGVFDFFDGGAEDETTLRANRAGFERLRLRPRLLVDVQQPDLSTTIVGGPAAAPLVIAPTGAIGAGWPGADVAIARAAARLGIPYTLSTTATSSIEEVAKQAGGRLWFQLYVLRDQAFTESLLQRAHAAGYEALVVTLDLATGGKRERDLRNRFTVPLRPNWQTIRDFASRPGWCLQVLRHGQPRFENLWGFEGNADPRASIAAKVGASLDASFDWDALQRLRARWPGRFLVKGVARGEDAARLASLGVDGIWVSNHGGRQLDDARATVDVLPEVAEAVAGRVPIVVDGGFQRGTDVIKGRALGATVVAMGKACSWGLTIGGADGIAEMLRILREEIRIGMGLSGNTSMRSLPPKALRRVDY
jgi:isopentenyl diphosphate isomerase/L-lactate dehydrogenase-like FMN-dependent dehydrogenase